MSTREVVLIFTASEVESVSLNYSVNWIGWLAWWHVNDRWSSILRDDGYVLIKFVIPLYG